MRPIYPAALLGYRSWYLNWNTLELQSLAIKHAKAWQPGVNKAVCDHNLDHAAPNSYCSCGLYAWHDPEKLISAATMRMALKDDADTVLISGAVVARGNIEAHADGWRAAESQIIGFCYQAQGKKNRRIRKRLQALGEKYQVPIFENTRQLQQYAEQLGSAFPESERLQPDSTSYVEASAELQISAAPEARAARDLLQVHGIGLETAEHFHIGVWPNQRCIRAPIFFDGADGDTGGLENSIGAPIFAADHCKVCGAIVHTDQLRAAYIRNKREAKRSSWGRSESLVILGPQKDYRSCPDCGVDSEAAGVGWMMREGRAQLKGYFWERSGVRAQSDFYHLRQAEPYIAEQGHLYLCNDIFNLWALWSRGYRALTACPRLNTLGLDNQIFDEVIDQAAKIAARNHGRLIFVSRQSSSDRQMASLEYILGDRAIAASAEDLGLEHPVQSLGRYQLDASDYYPN